MSKCNICSKPFSWILRQHRCKNCLRAVCSDCGCHKRPVYSFDPTGAPHRVCTECVDENKVDKLLPKPMPNTLSPTVPESSGDDDDLSYVTHDIRAVLEDPTTHSISTWLSTFNKCWLRSKYPQYYIEKQKELLEMAAQPNLTKRKRKVLTKSHDVIGRGFHFKPKPKRKNPIAIINAGMLWINIVNAINIPNCDVGSKPDCYVRYFVTNNDTLFLQNDELKKYRTKMQNNTFIPTWNEQRSIIITNTTGKLILELWDDGVMSNDVLLGRLEIKLSSLFLHHACSKQAKNDKMIDDWFEITIAEQWKDKMRQRKSISRSSDTTFIKPEGRIPQPENIYEQIESIPSIDAGELKGKSKCCIRLQMHLESSWWAHFISHFDPVLPQLHKVPWSINLTLHELNLLQWVFEDSILSKLQPIVYWIDYPLSVLSLVVFTVLIYAPWFFIFCVAFMSLVCLCYRYIVTDEKKKQKLHLPVLLHWLCLLFGNLPVLLQRIMTFDYGRSINTQQSFMMFDQSDSTEFDIFDDENDEINEDTKVQNAESEEISMTAFGRFAASKAIKVAGLKRKIWWMQELLVVINESVNVVWGIINWDHEYMHITSLICFVLFGLCVLCVVFREVISLVYLRHVLYVGGMIGLSYYSKPFQFLLWLILGSSYWYFNYYKRYQLLCTKSLGKDAKPKKNIVKTLWCNIGGLVLWMINMFFFPSVVGETSKLGAFCLTSVSDRLVKTCEDEDNKEVRSKSATLIRDKSSDRIKMLRNQIVKQFTGGFDMKFQYVLTRLKYAKMLLF